MASLIQQARLTKPLYIFTLSWNHGVQHGQDPAMFTDAGAGVLLPMLYQMKTQQHFELTMRQWADFMRPGQANLAPGDQVDDYWHQRSRNPAAPELMCRRMVAAQKQMIYQGTPVGAFWHDISRALKGPAQLGPYPGTEWALAGAAAFSQVRQANKVYPVECVMSGPSKGKFGQALPVTVTIKNNSGVAINNLTLKLEDTPGVKPSGQGRKTVPALGAGEKLEVPMAAVVAKPDGARANRFMVCLRLTWPAKDYGKQYRSDLPQMFVLMQYVQLSASGG